MYHKSIAVLLLITLFVFSGITFVGNKAGYDSFWFCIITILASTGFSLLLVLLLGVSRSLILQMMLIGWQLDLV